ncbi:dihydrofolate reductase family protein [Streptomyces qinzhouensis]|uniref:Dihydrofolate reductase n=1 Tax=Streptomyces qinzhouensis TaxID=2599401 RepID=A0A5B8JIF7_9ACTN|nr:dihydrofolate reductase family protein [Streptomyces qinzhouensis]QDY77303.1 dihydrofolate reductase [Streptomyces qinzhouensis]
MRKLVYYVGVTLDGRIAGPGGEYDFFLQDDEKRNAAYSAWMSAAYPETVPTAFRAASGVADTPNRTFDTVVMGLGTWLPGLAAGMTSPYAHLRQYVVSSTLDPATDPALTVVPDDPLALVRRLKREEGGLDIWLCGGGKLAGALLPEIDELVFKSYPVIAGAGVPVVDGGFDPTAFDVVQRTTFDNGVCVTRFARR